MKRRGCIAVLCAAVLGAVPVFAQQGPYTAPPASSAYPASPASSASGWSAAGTASGFATGAAAAPATLTPNVEASGQAPIAGGDRVRGRERALDDAFRVALEQAATALIGAQGLAERASLFRLTIQPRARSYVTGYRVLEESELNGMFLVRVAAVLDLERLERDLAPRAGAADRRPPQKAVVCLVRREQPSPAANASAGANAAVAAGDGVARSSAAPIWTPSPDGDRLAAAVAALGPSVAPMTTGCLPEGDAPAPSDARAAEAARRSFAQAAVVGTVAVDGAGRIRGTPLVAAHATVELHLVEPDGRVAANVRAERDGWGDAPAPAAVAASRPALDAAIVELSPALARQWPRPDQAGVRVRLAGVESWADLQLFQHSAGAIPGVVAVEPHRFSVEGVELLVRGEVTAPALAGALARGPDGARFRPVSRGERALDVQLLPPPPPPPTTGLPPASSGLFPAPPPHVPSPPGLPGAPR